MGQDQRSSWRSGPKVKVTRSKNIFMCPMANSVYNRWCHMYDLQANCMALYCKCHPALLEHSNTLPNIESVILAGGFTSTSSCFIHSFWSHVKPAPVCRTLEYGYGWSFFQFCSSPHVCNTPNNLPRIFLIWEHQSYFLNLTDTENICNVTSCDDIMWRHVTT